MHVVVNRDSLNEAVAQATKAVSSRTTIPILTGIKCSLSEDEFNLTGSDSDVSIQATIPQQIDDKELFKVVKLGSIVLPAKYFSEIVKKLPHEQVEIEVMDQFVVHIRSGNSEFHLNGLDAGEYPQLPQIEEDQLFSVPSNLFKTMLRQTSFAVSTQESRPILTGVLWTLNNGELKMVATDSHRLSQRKAAVEWKQELTFENVVIPGKSLHELQRILPDDDQLIDIVVTNNQILVKSKHILFFSRLLEGAYPDTERIIPQQSQTEIFVETKGLLQAIERASLLAPDGKHHVQLTVTDDTLQLTSNTPEVGRVSEQVQLTEIRGEEFRIAFNAKYALEALRVTDSPEIKIEFTGTMSPFVIKPLESEHMLHLILPIRTY